MMCRKYFNSEMGNDGSPEAPVDRRSRSRLKSTRSRRRDDSSRSVRSHANHHNQTRSHRSPSRRSRSRVRVQSRSRADRRRHSRADYRTRSRSSHRPPSPTGHRSRSRSGHSRAVQRGHTETSRVQRQYQQRSSRQVLTPDRLVPETLTNNGNVSLTQLIQALHTIGKNNSNDRLPTQNTLPDFDPSRKEQTIDMWLHKVNECAVIYDWTDKQTTHYALPKLKGTAQKWYEGLNTVMFTWKEWQDKLRLAFPNDDNYGRLLSTMLAKRARFNESLEDYFYDKVVLLNRCGIEGKKAVDCIVFGIDDRTVRLGAESARFETPEQLLPFLISTRGTNNVNDRKRVRNADSSVSRDDTRRDRVIICFNCSQRGHYKSQCPSPIIKCNKCLRFGHTSDKCENGSKNLVNTNSKLSSNSVMLVAGINSNCHKYYKEAVVNGILKTCFIDFGSAVSLIRMSDVESLDVEWVPDNSIPPLIGFGNSMVKPIGKFLATVKIDHASALVELVIVPDEVLKEPLLIGRSFTEQPHIMVEKNNVMLKIFSNEIVPTCIKYNLYCTNDTIIDGLTLVEFSTDPSFTGDVYIEGSNRFKNGEEHYLVQGLFSIVNGLGIALVKGISSRTFTIKRGTVIARCTRAEPVSDNNNPDVLRVDEPTPLRNISGNEIMSDGTLSTKTINSLILLLNKYRQCFAFSLQELGKTDLVNMSIKLKDDEPVVYRPYRLPVCERNKVRELVNELVDCKIVRPSTSPYASPIVVVKKKTGEVRLCVDYRALNRKTYKENFPLPRIDDQLDSLAGYQYYTVLDLASGYYQISINEEDRYKTSFVTPDGQFEFNRMPFGLANAPANFMRMINLVLSSARDIASAYMDDIIIPSNSIEEGLSKLEKVLQLLSNAGLTLKLSKCYFFSKSVDYLGFELSKEGIRPGTRKIQSVKEFPEPCNLHTVRQFIGLCSFFRRFIKNFSNIAKPLTSLLKKDSKWEWGSEQKTAFNTLKEILLQKPVLKLYDPNDHTELHTDASKLGIAGILMQRGRDNLLRPVAYYSRQTTIYEQHMTAYELETLALVASLQRFRVYLIGVSFKVVTDCNSLRATFLKKDLIPRVARWWITMQEFDFSIEYRPGKTMSYIDALSRNPPLINTENSETVMVVEESDWLSTVQEADSEIQRIVSILKDPASINIADITKNYVLRNNRLFRVTDQGNKWVVPKGVRWQILKQCHDDIGHFAFDKTLAKVKETYWFSKMRRFVKKYVESCLECAYVKASSNRKPPLNPIPKVDSPFATLHLDHVGPFVKSSKGNTHILVIIDAYTKFIIIKAVRSTKVSIVIDKLKEYFSIFGMPKRIISDRGSSFTSNKFKDFLHGLGIKRILNAVSTPRANGQVERYNRTLLDALTAMCNGQDEKKWDVYVPGVQWGLNNTHNKGIGTTPAKALFGTTLVGLTENRVKSFLGDDHEIDSNKVSDIRDKINEYISAYQNKSKEQHNKNSVQPKIFKIGDLVSVAREIQSSGQSRKLVPKFQGPYRIASVLGNDRYEIVDTPLTRKGNRKYTSVAAVDKLKPWLSYNRPDEIESSNDDNIEDSDCEP